MGECSEDDAPDREEDACRLLEDGMMTFGDGASPHAHYCQIKSQTFARTLVCTAPVDVDPFRFSLQNEHCVAGLPFFLTSNNGRSVCVHPDTRCPLMQVAHANFLSLMRTIFAVYS